MSLDNSDGSATDFTLTKKSSKTPLVVLGIAAVAAVGFFVWRSAKQRDDQRRKQSAEEIRRACGDTHLRT